MEEEQPLNINDDSEEELSDSQKLLKPYLDSVLYDSSTNDSGPHIQTPSTDSSFDNILDDIEESEPLFENLYSLGTLRSSRESISQTGHPTMVLGTSVTVPADSSMQFETRVSEPLSRNMKTTPFTDNAFLPYTSTDALTNPGLIHMDNGNTIFDISSSFPESISRDEGAAECFHGILPPSQSSHASTSKNGAQHFSVVETSISTELSSTQHDVPFARHLQDKPYQHSIKKNRVKRKKSEPSSTATRTTDDLLSTARNILHPFTSDSLFVNVGVIHENKNGGSEKTKTIKGDKHTLLLTKSNLTQTADTEKADFSINFPTHPQPKILFSDSDSDSSQNISSSFDAFPSEFPYSGSGTLEIPSTVEEVAASTTGQGVGPNLEPKKKPKRVRRKPQQQTTSDESPATGISKKLWQFLLDTLANKTHNPSVIKWLDRKKGMFKICNNHRLAELWTQIRRRQIEVRYEFFARALRHYYGKKILHKLPGKKSAYQFGDNCRWKEYMTLNKH